MRFFAGDVAEQYKRFVLSVGALRERARNSEPVGRVLAVGPLGFTVEPCHRPGLLLIGDSAGFLDPITGEGMTVALKSVKAAVPLVREAFATGRFGLALGRRYAAERSQQIADVFRFTQLLLNLSRYKPMADRAIRRLSKDEALYRKLLGIVSGIRRFNDLSPGERASLIPG
jgi:flavin-dependent dehydrogenase